jgi:hypothetical protein
VTHGVVAGVVQAVLQVLVFELEVVLEPVDQVQLLVSLPGKVTTNDFHWLLTGIIYLIINGLRIMAPQAYSFKHYRV